MFRVGILTCDDENAGSNSSLHFWLSNTATSVNSTGSTLSSMAYEKIWVTIPIRLPPPKGIAEYEVCVGYSLLYSFLWLISVAFLTVI